MQKLYLLSLFLLATLFGNAQELSINTLENLLNKNSWQDVNRYFSGTNWEYDNSEDGDSENVVIYSWSYNKDSYSEKAMAWLFLYSQGNTPEMIAYGLFDNDIFDHFQSEMNNSNYERYDQDSEDEKVTTYYKNSKFYVSLTIDKIEDNDQDGPKTQYIILVKKRGGFYDPNNGAKKVYYDDGTLKQTYHLLNGEFNGLREFYYPNGKLKISVEYSNDVENGNFTHYYYDDEGESDGKLVLKETGEYYNGEKEGVWMWIHLGNNEYRTIQIQTYTNGIKNGPFQEAQGDSLIIGSYRGDSLDGQYRIYFDMNRFLLGGVIDTDTSQLELVTTGYYSVGKKSGHWWRSNFAIVSEGDYFDDKKTGEWNYQYLEEKNDDGEEFPFSNQLFLTENYLNGRLNGLSNRYWFVYHDKHPCSDTEKHEADTDSCYSTIYTKMLQTAYYKHGELDGLYEVRDASDNIVFKGYFINGLKDGGWVEGEFEDDDAPHQIESSGFYNRGIKEGDWTEKETIRNDSGEPFTITGKGKYEDNTKNGVWKCYDNSGLHIITANYKSDKLDGKNTYWYDEDTPREVMVFDQGKLTELSKYKPENTGQPYLKYQITNETSSWIGYMKTVYSEDGYTSQKYTMSNNFEGNELEDLVGTFLIFYKANRWQNDEGYKNGAFHKYDKDGKLVQYGIYNKENKIGTWITYFNDQNVQIEKEYDAANPALEKYVVIETEKPFSGTFIYTDQEFNTKEIRSIKNGFRNGTTKIYTLDTDKLIKKEKYEDGILKE